MAIHGVVRGVFVLLPPLVSGALSFLTADAHGLANRNVVFNRVLLRLDSDGAVGDSCLLRLLLGRLIRVLRIARGFVWIWFVKLCYTG